MRDYSVLDDLDEGIQIIDHNMCYVYLNKKLLSEVKMKPKDILGYSMTEKFPKIDQTDIYNEILRCLQKKEPKRVLNEFTFPDGRHTFYEVNLQPIEEGVLLSTRDITSSKKGEILLQETNKHLEQFAHIAAHDMREPVRRIEILCEMLLLDYTESLPKKAKQICENLQNQSRSLMQLISDFRKLSGIGGKDLKRKDFLIVEFAKTVTEEFDFNEKDIELKWPAQDTTVSAYSSLVAILLRNLYENAFKHGRNEIELVIENDTSHSQPIISITNKTSVKAHQKDIFLPFVTGDHVNHTGLGLAITKKIIDHHDGKIWSEQDGETFKISFTLGL